MDGLIRAQEQLIAKKRDLKQAAMQQLLTAQHRLPGFSGEWVTKTLGELFTFTGGYSASRDQLSHRGHCYLHYGDIHTIDRTVVDATADYASIPKLDIPLKHVSSGSLLEDGDVVFVDASEDDEGTSKHVVVVNKDKRPFISGLHTIVAKSKTEELAHSYRRFCFQTKATKNQFKFYAVGTKVSGISKSNIPKLKLPIPPLPEQTAIAEVLSEQDEELAALEARLSKIRALKQGMMQSPPHRPHPPRMNTSPTASAHEHIRSFIEARGTDWVRLREGEIIRNQQERHHFSPLRAITIKEMDHSRLLGDLLNPYGSHGEDPLFLHSFLARIGMDQPESGKWRVTVEQGRVDIIFRQPLGRDDALTDRA